jgi:threonine synthase
MAQEWLQQYRITVLVLTGHGLKDPSHSTNLSNESLVIEPDLKELEKILGGKNGT